MRTSQYSRALNTRDLQCGFRRRKGHSWNNYQRRGDSQKTLVKNEKRAL